MQLFEAKVDKEKVKRKRKKKDNDDKEKPARRASNASSANSSAMATEIPKKRRRKDKDKVAKVKQEEIVNVEEDEDDDDDDDEICAAASCSRPQGDEVGWVQCDICEKWYHLACVGLSPERAEAMDSYNCRLCVGGGGGGSSSTNSAVGTPPAASPESENIDVDGTTPTSLTPPVSIADVEVAETTQQQEQEAAETAHDHGNNDTVMRPVTTIDLCSDDESTHEDMAADENVVDIEIGNTA